MLFAVTLDCAAACPEVFPGRDLNLDLNLKDLYYFLGRFCVFWYAWFFHQPERGEGKER